MARVTHTILPPRRLGVALVAAGALLSALIANAGTAGVASLAAATIPCAGGTTVQTTTGAVCGIVVNGVREWLGIPYAAPPVGNLRWAPPQPHAAWTTTVEATAFGSSCATPAFPAFNLPPGGSEDCLFVNVWQPPGEPASGLPVLVHIHGGGFLLGSGNGDNTLLANTGHEVVVSLNYRLGIFGFLAESALGSHSGDYGLQDQQAALRWVKENISSFGGDPNNVTIFGESAGGSSVCDHIASPTSAGLFQKAISTSGEYSPLFGVPVAGTALETQDCKSSLPSPAQAESAGASFAAALGCGNVKDVAACLRSQSTTSVEQAAGFGYQLGGHGTIAPTINGTTLTMTLRDALEEGKANRVPVIAGVARDENLISQASTPTQYTQLVDQQYGRIAKEVLGLYPLKRFNSPFAAFRTVAADSDTVCPALATDRALAHWMPVYAYEVDDGNAPGGFPGGNQPNGSFHVADWFLTPTPNLNANLQVLQDQEVAGVTTFARTGNPSADFTPMWPQFGQGSDGEAGTDRSPVMSLAPGADSQTIFASQIAFDHNCGFWDSVSPRARG